MPNFPRTDLAVEAEAIHRSAAAVTELPGVRAEETERRGFAVTEVHVLDVAGENALCKPMGDYYTLALDPLLRREDDAFENAAQTLAELLRGVLPLMPDASVLVVGLGNREITPDAIGPEAVRNLIVTRHLGSELPEALTGLTSVAACQPGVLGQTGIESLALVKSAMQTAQPDVVIVIDALAAAEPGRLFRTVQLTDTGIVPGSGVGNSRQEFSQRTLGVPVVAVGVPTVMDAAGALQPALTRDMPQGLLVTLRDVDARVREMGRLVGYGCDLALHRGLSLAEIPTFLS